MIIAHKKVFSKMNTQIHIGVYYNRNEVTAFKTSFLSNIKLKKHEN